MSDYLDLDFKPGYKTSRSGRDYGEFRDQYLGRGHARTAPSVRTAVENSGMTMDEFTELTRPDDVAEVDVNTYTYHSLFGSTTT